MKCQLVRLHIGKTVVSHIQVIIDDMAQLSNASGIVHKGLLILLNKDDCCD